ncbi:23S ribosomal RNA methyltransferase [Trametes sanguinea]|nr:23S ribosomal RNA methyltransferase [Trametes sanguinea]
MPLRPTCPLFSGKLPASSRAWLARQSKDPYVKARTSHAARYRSRSAFKLLELNEAFHFLDTAHVNTVVDLGAAPGGWSQVVAEKFGWTSWDTQPLGDVPKRSEGQLRDSNDAQDQGRSPTAWAGTIIAVDLLRMEPIPGVKTVQMDFLSPQADAHIHALMLDAGGDGKADVILSDMAANFTGNPTADAHASLELHKSVFEFAKRHLRRLKHFAHPGAHEFRKACLKPHFNHVTYHKPKASRVESAEAYWVCMGWKGVQPSKPSSTR